MDARKEPATTTGPVEDSQAPSVFVREQARNVGMGLVVGLFGALLGVGGGIILTPLLTGLAKFTQHKAHGTTIFVVCLTSMTAIWRYAAAGKVDWLAVASIAVTSIIGAMIGARCCALVPARELRMLFGGFLGIVGITMLATGQASIGSGGAGGQTTETILASFVVNGVTLAIGTKLLTSLAIGLVAGIVSGLLGIGGGPILVPAGVFLLGFDQAVAQGVSVGVILPTSITGAITHYRLGNTVLPMVFALAIPAVVGAFIGSQMAAFVMAPEVLRRLFGLLLVGLAIQTFWRFWGTRVLAACHWPGYSSE